MKLAVKGVNKVSSKGG